MRARKMGNFERIFEVIFESAVAKICAKNNVSEGVIWRVIWVRIGGLLGFELLALEGVDDYLQNTIYQ